MQCLDRGGRCRLYAIGDSHKPGKPLIDNDEHHRLTTVSQRLQHLAMCGHIDAEIGHHRRVAKRHGSLTDIAAHAFARRRVKARDIE